MTEDNKTLPPTVSNDLFVCERLIDNNNYYLVKTRFKAIHEADGLTKYFQKQSKKDDEKNYCRNYVVRFKGRTEIVACFTLKIGSVPYLKEETSVFFSKDSKLIPGIELVNIALNDIVLEKIKSSNNKIGRSIYFEIIETIIQEIVNKTGAQIVYLFALNEQLANYYESWGFYKVEDTSYNKKLATDWQNSYSHDCIFMYKPTKEIQINY